MASDLNNLVLDGRLTRDAEIKTVGNNKVANFSIANNRYYKKGTETVNEVSYFDIEAWGKEADRIEEFGKKGTHVRIFGRVRQNRWNDKDGKAQSQVVFLAQNLVVIPRVPGQPTQAEEGADDEE